MHALIEKLKQEVIEASKNTSFIHHDWFVEYHLSIVENISLELCELYPDADKDIVLALVWIHDYGKIFDKEKEHDVLMFEKGREKLLEIGFKESFVSRVIDLLTIFEKKMELDLSTAPIEVQIVSSADAASHLIGPFFHIYWKENSEMSIEDLMVSNKAKIQKDLERKMVLPEVKKAFEQRYKLVMEQAGDFPHSFLK